MVLRQQEWLRERSLKSVVSLTGKQPVKVAGDGCCMGGLDRLRYRACNNVHHCVCYTDTGHIMFNTQYNLFSFFLSFSSDAVEWSFVVVVAVFQKVVVLGGVFFGLRNFFVQLLCF